MSEVSSGEELTLGCDVGAGIAQVAAQNGFKVVLSDVTEVRRVEWAV